MRGRKYFRLLKGGRRERRWHRPEAYGAEQGGGWRRYAPLWIGAAAVGLFVGIVPGQFESFKAAVDKDHPQLVMAAAGSSGGVRASFGFCHTGGGYNCVVDGDTIWLQGQKIRIADIDAPETHEPKCASEKALGDRATSRLQQLVNSGSVTLRSIDRDEDHYGRKLRIVMVDGESVGDTLVGEGLARWYGNGRRRWC